MISGFLAKVVRAAGGCLDRDVRAGAEGFCGAKPDIDWQDPAVRKTHLQEPVTAAGLVLASTRGIDDETVAEPAGLLAQVIGRTSRSVPTATWRSAAVSPRTG